MPDSDDVLAAALERAAALADPDPARLQAMLHPAFGWTSHRGERFDRDSYLAATGRTGWRAQELQDPVVRVVGDTAVLRCVAVDTVGPGPERFVMPMTQTWVRTGGRWLLLAGHAGPRLTTWTGAT